MQRRISDIKETKHFRKIKRQEKGAYERLH